jgi:hypothetical protein
MNIPKNTATELSAIKEEVDKRKKHDKINISKNCDWDMVIKTLF